ncbi:MAG TPA: ABC transporter ATP-binding protein [Burkholderiaceae bacterium]|nr:ABC transporter ATP-binding protein [Burkholderiaceae bacterium]HQR71899.1 ABC transporter ATP-binding protein [Burkholderiaceae bacterium]
MTHFVEFDGVCKTYDGRSNVVDGLDLAIAEGEFLSLLGPSGSGKTTTLMMLAGFERPTAGHIRLKGQSIEALPPYKRNFGMVFQNYALFPHMTVGENLAFPLSVRGAAKDDAAQRVKRALDMVRLPGMETRMPAQLSGGQQQRVAVARALVFEPQLILMDEPLGALDKQLREEMQLELRGLHERLGITMVYVTHDQSEAMTMSDRVAVFQHGCIQQIDDPRTLYERPANLFVASFIGENNRLKARVAGDGTDGECVVQLDGGTEVRGRSAGACRPQAPATVSIRPEHIDVVAATAPASADNRLPARVAETIFLGGHVRVRLQTAAGEVVANVPVQAAHRLPPEGAEAVAQWAAASTVVFPE